MKKSQFTDQQIAFAVQQAEAIDSGSMEVRPHATSALKLGFGIESLEKLWQNAQRD